jgi:16S rRNA processing protein RimM
MGRTDPGFLVVGHLDKPHGIRGELVVSLHTDHPDRTFVPGAVVQLADASGDAPDPALPPLCLESARPFRRGLIVAFDGIETRTEAEVLRGRYLLLARTEIAPLEEGEVFHHQLLGMEVVTVEGEAVGEVAWVHDLIPTVLLEVQGEERELMIPFRPEIVVQVDAGRRRIVVDPPEGLLDL